jgi:hypothetical protein
MTDERKNAKEKVSNFLKGKHLGGMKVWRELHKERTEAGDNRG